MNQKEDKKPAVFTIPHETSWHFERTLKPNDKSIDNYVLIEPGASDIVKVLKAYSHHPVTGYNIATIEIVYNEQLNRLFFAQMTTMNKRKDNPKYTPTWKTQTHGAEKQHRETTYQKLHALSAEHPDASVPNMTLLPLWHGTSEMVSDHIFNTGYGIFNSNDPAFVTDNGFFGKGVYTAHEADYSFRCYAQKHGDKAVLLLNWVTLLEAYPIIHGDMPNVQGKPIGYDNCDAHFIPVRSPLHPNTDVYYPCHAGEPSHYTEVVVFNSAQCLPRYRVKLVKNTPKPPLDDSAITSYQMGLDLFGLGHYAQVSTAFEEALDAGHPGAAVRLHWLHAGASGVMAENASELAKYQTVSTTSIDDLTHQASYQSENDQEAQFTLGWCYQQGLGVEINLAKAAHYYWIAASQGHRDAQYQLGVCCAAGMGVNPNMQAAMGYYEKAAAQNHIHAHYVLSQCYTFGFGVLPDAAKATVHRQAAQKGRHPLLSGPLTQGQPAIVWPTTMTTTTTVTTPSTPSNHLEEMANLKATLAQKEKFHLVELKQQHEQNRQQKQKFDQEIHQLKQTVFVEKQTPQTKDKMLVEKEIQRQQQALSTKEQELHTKDQQLGEKQQENRQLITKIQELEKKLRISRDAESALKKQLDVAQSIAPPPVQPFGGNLFAGIFTTPSPFPSSPVNANQAKLTTSQQVEMASKAVQDKINPEKLKALLKWVTEGHLVEVEKLLQKSPTLALGTGKVKDRSNRTFTHVTALQYAAWALDAEMCELVIGYLGAHHTSIQLKALSNEPDRYSAYGASYDYTSLVTKQKDVDNYGSWTNDRCQTHWQKEVGGEQRKCPAWLIYAWSEEGADVAWTKQDVNRKIKREYDKNRLDWWFTQNYNDGRGVGSSWAVFRGPFETWTCTGGGIVSKIEVSVDRVIVLSFGKLHCETLQRLRATADSQLSQVSMGLGKGQ